jgi:hypothetical protein
MKLKKTTIAMAGAVVALAAIAKTFGPFSISALGGDYVTTSLQEDASAEYSGANRLAGIYLAPLLNTPAAIRQANKGDFVRIVYMDGQIADFRIKRWPSTNPLDFDSTVPTVNSRHLTEQQDSERERAMNSCAGGSSSYTLYLETKYLGSITESDGNGGLTVTGSWISTGYASFVVPVLALRCQYR